MTNATSTSTSTSTSSVPRLTGPALLASVERTQGQPAAARATAAGYMDPISGRINYTAFYEAVLAARAPQAQPNSTHCRLEIISSSGDTIGTTINSASSPGNYVDDQALESLERQLKRHVATYVAAALAADLIFPLIAVLRDRDAPVVLLHIHADGSIHDAIENGAGIARCANCGALHVEGDGQTVSVEDRNSWRCHGQQWCAACVEDHAFQCSDCSEYFPDGDSINTASGDSICPTCADDYCTCDDCGELHYSEDVRTVDESEIVCRHCLERGEGSTYFYTPSGWSTTPQVDDDDDDDEHQGPHADIMRRHPYHTDANDKLGHTIPDTGHTYGAEMEYRGNPDNWHAVAAACHHRAILTDDSSVSGELVTAALTAGQIRRWLRAITPALTGTHNDSQTGFHIHIDRRALTPWQWFQLTHYAKTHADTLETIAGRGSNGYSDLQRLPAPDWPTFASHWANRTWPSRYTGINLDKGPTVEFRLNRATKTKARALARFALIQRLVALGRLAPSQRPQTGEELRGWLAQDANIREVTGWNVGPFNYRAAMNRPTTGPEDHPPAAPTGSELERMRQELERLKADRTLTQRLENRASWQEGRSTEPRWRRDCRAREMHYYRQGLALRDRIQALRNQLVIGEAMAGQTR